MQVLGHERVGNMEMDKVGKARHARDLARWFREQLRDGTAGEHIDLMAATAMALECEAFRLERDGGPRRHLGRPHIVSGRAA
jgi:hypothetical protein